VRDILYAEDVARAFHAFYEKQVPGVYNIGGGLKHAISLRECIDLIAELSGRSPVVNFQESRHGDLQYFVCNSAKARRTLGWEATVGPREGIGRLMSWVNQNLDLFAAAQVQP
jgi:CDP-paratose 2-epimerase